MSKENLAGDDPIVIHRHVHAAPPLAVTDATAEREGFTVRGWRKLARAARAAGYAVADTSDGYTMLRADLEVYLRERGRCIEQPEPQQVEPANDDEKFDPVKLAREAGRKAAS